MQILCFPSGPFETNAYLVACEETKAAVIIDPASGSAPFINDALETNHWTPQAIWLTHSHWDHIADAKPLMDRWAIPLLVHPLDADNVRNPGADGLPSLIEIPPLEPDGEWQNTLSVGNLLFQVLHTPGHSPGSVCFHCEKENVVFSGDTLFKQAMGNLSFPTSQPEKMQNSLNTLAALPSETRVYPGHGPTTTIGLEPWIRSIGI